MRPSPSLTPRGLAFFGAVTALCVAFSACQRSAEYKHDEDIYGGDPASYYARQPGNPRSASQRVESMGQPKKRVVVLDFWNDTPVHDTDVGGFAAGELKRVLAATERLIIPTDLHTDKTTSDFVDPSQRDKVRVAQLVREGRRMGVAVLVIGRVAKIVFRQRGDDVGLLRQRQSLAAVDLEIKVFDVAAGREIMAAAKSGQSSSSAVVAFENSDLSKPEFRTELTKLAVRDAVGFLVPDVLRAIEKMAWQGRIAKISGTKVYVNAGRASGLVIGDILKVNTPGDDVYDPASGAFLGRTQGQLKGTLEVDDFLGPDGAVTEIHTGGNFQEGDTVQLY